MSFTLHRSPFTRKWLYRRLQPAYTRAVQWLVIDITIARPSAHQMISLIS